MKLLSPDEVARLSPPERLALIAQLWDSLEHDRIPLTAAQEAELNRRLECLDEERQNAVSWAELKAELRQGCPWLYSVQFTQIARTELVEAQDWYETKVGGLGRRFREAIDRLIDRMSANTAAISHRSQERAPRPLAPLSLRAVLRDRGRWPIACYRLFSRQPRTGPLAKANLILPAQRSNRWRNGPTGPCHARSGSFSKTGV
jgi:putative addiction module component (TIGR02574 family)